MDTGTGYPSLLLKCFGLSLILAFTQSCAVSIHSTHEPMHPDAGKIVYLGAEATGSVDKIEIWAAVSKITVCDETAGDPEEDSWEFRRIASCNPFGWRRSLTCWGSMRGSELPDRSQVRYLAIAASPLARTSVEQYYFAVGEFPCVGQPVPIRVQTYAFPAAIDVVVIPDPDLNEALFLEHLDDLIDFKFFKYDTFRDSRKHYNFWYSREAGRYFVDDTRECRYSGPDPTTDPEFAIAEEWRAGDALLFLHGNRRTDCAVEEKFSGEFWNELSIVHEAGHAIFGLRDEYSKADSHVYGPQTEGPPNLWATEAECIAGAQQLDLDGRCKKRDLDQVGSHAIIDPQGVAGCIMGDQLRSSDFGPACRLRAKWKHALCATGVCHPGVETP